MCEEFKYYDDPQLADEEDILLAKELDEENEHLRDYENEEMEAIIERERE